MSLVKKHFVSAYNFIKSLIGNLIVKQLNQLWSKRNEIKKETKVGLQSLFLFLCILFATHLGDTAIAVSSTYGDRELPIYSVDTDEKKISISFDAAWGDTR